jgi:ankyrin repeat protein
MAASGYLIQRKGPVGPFLRFWLWLIVTATMIVAVQSSAYAQQGGQMLIEAVAKGDRAVVEQALREGAPVDTRDAAGRTALLIATRADRADIAEVLIAAGADVNAKDNIRDTPFLYAGAEGRNEILKMILATGRADLADTNRYGGTALIPAAHRGHPETVRILLGTAIDIDHVNNLGWTALLEAVILGDGGLVYQEIVGSLVSAGARNIPDADGVTPLQHAQNRRFHEVARRIEAGR